MKNIKNGFQIKLVIKELILHCGAYIPVKDELYDEKIHTKDVSVNESYSVIDKNIGIHENNTDKRIDYLNRNNYMKGIQNLFFQKEKSLKENIRIVF